MELVKSGTKFYLGFELHEIDLALMLLANASSCATTPEAKQYYDNAAKQLLKEFYRVQ